MRFSLLTIAALFTFVVVACSDDPQSTSSSSGGTSGTPAPADPKFKTDVMPIMIQSCALSSCHSSKEAPAGVNITSDPAVTYAAFMKESATFKGTKIVVPGDPEASLLMRKMDGTQAANEGKPMPPEEEEGVSPLLSKRKRDTIRNWIKNGAKDN